MGEDQTDVGPNEGSRERILAAAVKIFGERGYDRTTVRAICDAAGTNLGLVPYYFKGGKEELWRAAASQAIGTAITDIELELALLDGAPLAARLEQTLRAIVHGAAKHPELHRFIQSAANGSSPERHDWMVERYTRPAAELMLNLFEEGRAAALVPDVEPAQLIYLVLGAASHQYLLHREVEKAVGLDVFDPASVTAHADALVATFLRTTHLEPHPSNHTKGDQRHDDDHGN